MLRSRFAAFIPLWLIALGAPSSAQVVISEFQAVNDSTLADEDNDYPDWIELFNSGTTTADLGNWYLTERNDDLARWRFPAGVTISPGQFLLVFASEKDRRNPAMPLHTNFRLNNDIGYLALVRPDGQTVAFEYAPFPAQLGDYSYGLSMGGAFFQFIMPGAAARTRVPTDDSLGQTWIARTFNDAGWTSGTTGVGYEHSSGYESLLGTDLHSLMYNITTSCYTRIPFTVADASSISGLTLRMKYDDGYLAYINGTLVAWRAAPSPPAWNSAATADHPDSVALVYDEVDISSSSSALVDGTNVLAIQGLNTSAGSSDFLIMPELEGVAAGDLDPDTMLYFPQPSPGRPNLPGYPGVAGMPEFSRAGGMIEGNISLTMTADAGVQIRYTTDRTDPTTSSALYAAPVSITATTTVRARGFVTGKAPSPIVEEAYVRLDPGLLAFTSDLPIVMVETFGRGIPQDPYAACQLVVIEPGLDGRAHMDQGVTFIGRGGLKQRGSSSLGFPKKSFTLETWDAHGRDLDVNLFDFARDSDWILYAPYTDKTMLRDALSYMWSNEMGRWASRWHLVEAFVNENGGNISQADYVGVYVFLEKIKRAPARVDIQKLYATDQEEPEITGGYILKKDRLDPGDAGIRTSNQGHVLGLVEPKEEWITAEQRAWILGWLNEFESVLYGANYKDPVNGYRKYIDVDSFIDQHILVEMTKNIDGYRLSAFMYKDRLGKLNMGPAWDYNLTLGNADYLQGWMPTGWYYSQLGAGEYPWYGQLFTDSDFNQRWIDRWALHRKGPFATDRLLADIDDWASVLAESQVRNFVKWPILGTYVWPNWYIGQTYQDEVVWMEGWLRDRVAWMDSTVVLGPAVSPGGGPINPGTSVILTPVVGTDKIYYTLDGRDPRASGGAIAAYATLYAAPIVLDANARLFARSRRVTRWSGPVDETYVVTTPPIVITEIMYHPVDPISGPYIDEDFEFIEFQNVGDEALDIAGARLSGGIDFTFPAGLGALEPGGYIVAVRNLDAFRSRYGSTPRVAGVYTGHLENAGEELIFQGPLLEPIHGFSYDPTWYPTTDGQGASLVIVNSHGAPSSWGLKASWAASTVPNGTPGGPDVDQGGLRRPGDSNGDGILDLSDAISLLFRLFVSGAAPLPCQGAIGEGGNLTLLDWTGDDLVNLSDVIDLLAFLYQQGPPHDAGTGCVPILGCTDACGG